MRPTEYKYKVLANFGDEDFAEKMQGYLDVNPHLKLDSIVSSEFITVLVFDA